MVLRIESWRHFNWRSLIAEVQLLRKWISIWDLSHKSQLRESRMFQCAKLLFLLMEKIRAFPQKLKIFGGRVLVNEFQFIFRVFGTFCWSDDIKVVCSFKLFIHVFISFWISLSRVDLAIFAFADSSRCCHFECLSCQLFQKVLSYLDFSKTVRCFTQYFASSCRCHWKALNRYQVVWL